MLKGTKVKVGSLVKIMDDVADDPMYQLKFWEEDKFFLRDPNNMSVLREVWISPGEVCTVVGQHSHGLVILTPRSHVGWIGKETMEIVK